MHIKIMVAVLGLAMSSAWSAGLNGKVVPAMGEKAAQVDSRLRINFDGAPVLGQAGSIKVFKSNGKLVDTIDLSGAPAAADTQTVLAKPNTEVDALGFDVINQNRYVYYRPVVIDGKTAVITLHNNKLEPETTYYVTVDAGVFTGKIAGAEFTEITKADGWSFKTRGKHKRAEVTVDDDGEADFRSVQGALNHVMSLSAADDADVAKKITIKNGFYNELLFLRGVKNLTITGESRDGVVVQSDNYETWNPGVGKGSESAGAGFLPGCTQADKVKCGRVYLQGGRAVLLVEATDLLTLSHFTLKNSHVKQNRINNMVIDNQAEAINFNSDGRLIARDMTFVSAQDTILTKGYNWFYRSLIAGDIDFIWGYPRASLFEESEIRSIVNVTNNTGYVLQARAASKSPGFVFLNSKLTAEAGVPEGSVYLARSGGAKCTAVNCDSIAFINTSIGAHISPEGWAAKPAPSPDKPVCAEVDGLNVCEGWHEFGSRNLNGSVHDVSKRIATSAQMSADVQAKGYANRKQVFQGFNGGEGWNPQP